MSGKCRHFDYVESSLRSGEAWFQQGKIYEVLCTGSLGELIEVFYSGNSTFNQVRSAGTKIFRFIYKLQKITLSVQRLNWFNQQFKVGVLRRLANLPLVAGGAAQHSLRAYLQLQDWLVLKSMSRDPK